MTYPQSQAGQQNPQPPGYSPSHPPPPSPGKKSNAGLIIGIVAAAALVLCGGVVACVAVLGNALNDAANNVPNVAGGNPGAHADPTTVTVGLNQPVRDGKLELTVTSVDCGRRSVGKEPLAKDAQGQFCLVSVTVKNIGTEARTFSSFNQHAYNASGAKYDADSSAIVYLDDASSFLAAINPGNSVNGIIVFDIPKDATITRLELHDSLMSDGVFVKLA